MYWMLHYNVQIVTIYSAHDEDNEEENRQHVGYFLSVIKLYIEMRNFSSQHNENHGNVSILITLSVVSSFTYVMR